MGVMAGTPSWPTKMPTASTLFAPSAIRFAPSAAIINLRQALAELDLARPDLAELAQRNGMKPLAGAEVYPNSSNGVRLPLCEGRTVLIDKPLGLVRNRNGRQVQDVEAYIGWILDENRQYMAKEEVLAYLRSASNLLPIPQSQFYNPRKRYIRPGPQHRNFPGKVGKRKSFMPSGMGPEKWPITLEPGHQ